MNDDFLQFRQQTLAQLRRASDRVRTQLIPELNAAGTPAREAFFAINRCYFEEDVFRGQMVGPSDAKQYLEDGGRGAFYETALADLQAPAAERGNAGGFETLHPRFVDTVVSRTFEALDNAGPFESGESLLRTLVIVDFLLQLAHFVKDGSGRTGEDLLVLLGARHGYPLTFSPTGYRAAVSGPKRLLVVRHVTQRISQVEVARNFLRSQGFVPPQEISGHIRDLLEALVHLSEGARSGIRQAPLTWPDDVRPEIEKIFAPLAPAEDESDPDLSVSHPYRLYATFLAKEALYLTLCLEDCERFYNSLKARYPLSLACRERDFRDAGQQTYLAVPKGAKKLADEAVAELDAARTLGKEVDQSRLDDCLLRLSKPAPDLAALISAERGYLPLESVLSQFRLPVSPSATPDDVRAALQPLLSPLTSSPALSRRSDTGELSRYSGDMTDTTTDAPVTPVVTADPAETPQLEFSSSRQFPEWLAEQAVSLAFTTYRAGKLFFIGLNPETSRLSIFERTFERCMGLTVAGNSLYMSSLYQLWRFENAVPDGEVHGGYDRVFVPQVGYVTGDIDVHDIAVDAEGRVVFVNTLFSCLATVSETHSFVPLWQPPFISRLAAEDRCHLNGLAMENGRPRYVTAVSQTDAADGWRERRRDGGVVIDVETSEIVADGLSMPHSPRLYRDKLWLHDSGTGYFGSIDTARGTFEPLTFCRGYLRGLSFIGDFAVVGLSLSRGSKTFEGLALEDEHAKRGVEPMCAIQVIDLRNGDIVHWLRIDGIVEELYDVVVLPGVRRPMAIGFRTDEIRRVISVGEA